MSDVTNVPVLSKAVKALSKSFSTLDDENQQAVIREIQTALRNLTDAVTELQQRQVADRTPSDDGKPRSGSRCEIFDGQFLRLTQTAASPMLTTVKHRLARIPQAVVWLQQSDASNNQFLVSGLPASNIAPASQDSVSFKLNGSIGDEHICILF